MKEKTQKEFFNEDSKGLYAEYSEGDFNLGLIKLLKNNKKTLSLGCGGGREVKELVLKGHEVMGIGFSENLIKQSEKIEPRVKYFCVDAIEFARNNKNKLKFDYILGLFSFLNYIEKDLRREFIENLMKMTEDGGEVIFEIRKINDRVKDLIKVFLAPFLALKFGNKWEFGDVYSFKDKEYTLCHHYTNLQVKKLLRGYNYRLRGTVIRIKND